VVEDNGHRWNVAPVFLRLAEPKDITPAAESPSGVIPAKK
jgi:hypothetical protein